MEEGQWLLDSLHSLTVGSYSSLSYSQRILIGQKGQLIAQIAQEVGRDLMDIFLCDVHIRLAVKLLK